MTEDERKGTYRCLRDKLWWAGLMWKKGDEYTGGPPKCKKGASLLKGDKPFFETVTAPKKPVEPEPEDNDPRTRKQIIEDIWTKYEDRVNPRLKRADLLQKEKDLQRLRGMDAATTAKTDYKVL